MIENTKEETDKKCPRCGGVMDYNPAAGKLKCPYCDYEEEIQVKEDAPKRAQELDFSQAEKTADCNWGMKTKTVICESCGAETVYDDLQTAAVCPFCGSNHVMEANNVNTMAPGGVVPFQITDKQASGLFKGWLKRKWFCPKLAKEGAKPDKFKGIYLPYWTFDTESTCRYRAQYGITHTTKDKDGNTRSHTNWYPASGFYQEFFNDELVFASSRHDPELLRGLEPFDTENNKAYKPEYIAGFVAERYSLGLSGAWSQAKTSILGQLEQSIRDKVQLEHHADKVRNVQMDTDFSNVTYKYLLLPVWMSSYKYKEKIYHFMVNGQTGKVAGKTPVSIPKVILTVLFVLAVLALVYYFSG